MGRNPQSSSCILCYFIVISLWVLWVLSHYVCLVWVCEFNFSGFFGCFPGFFFFFAMNFRGLFSGLWVFHFSDKLWLFNGSFCFLWVCDFSVDLSCSLVSLFFCDLSFFVRFPPWNNYKLQRNCVCRVIYSTTNVCMCFLIKFLLDYCNKETGVAILNFFIT